MRQKAEKILKWSEKYTKTDMLYLAKGGFWLTLGQIFASGAAFILSIAFANLLPQETYGTYRFVLSIAGILSISTLPGVWTAITQSVARGHRKTLILGTKVRLAFGIVGIITSSIISAYYFVNENKVLGISFIIVAIVITFYESFSNYDAYLYGIKDFRRSTKYFLINQTVSTTTLLVTLLLTNNVFIIIGAYFLPWTILRFFFFIKTKRELTTLDTEDPGVKKYGAHLSLISVLSVVAANIDKILVFHYLGALELAIYAFSIAIPDQMKAALNNVSSLALPKFSEKSKEQNIIGIWPKIAKFGVIVILASVVYVFVAPIIFNVFFPEYIESIKYSQIYALSTVGLLVSIPVALMQAGKETKKLYSYNIISSLIQMVLLYILVVNFGLMGAIISRVITRFVNLAISFIFIS